MAQTDRNLKIIQAGFAAALFLSQAAWSSAGFDVVFLGDNARVGLLEQCGPACRPGGVSVGTPDIGSTASRVAGLSMHAKHGVIVIDATQGPLPIVREHIQIARQAGVPSLSIMFVNMAGLEGMGDAGELVELVEMEVRSVMSSYDMKGHAAMVFHDSGIRAIPRLQTRGLGLARALDVVSRVPPRQVFPVARATGKRVASYLYLLSPQEAPGAEPVGRNAKVKIWVDGQVASGVVTSARTLRPGDNGELDIQFATAITATEGSRFLVEREDRIVAMGVIVRVDP